MRVVMYKNVIEIVYLYLLSSMSKKELKIGGGHFFKNHVSEKKTLSNKNNSQWKSPNLIFTTDKYIYKQIKSF